MSDDAGRPGLRQLLWIAAGVAVLTLLVVAASWLFSPRPSGSDAEVLRKTVALKEEQVKKDTFNPESPGGRSAPPPTPAPLPETQVQRPPVPSPETPPPAPPTPAPEGQPPAGPAAGSREEPAPPPNAGPVPQPAAASAPARGGFGVQVGAFSERSKAKEVAARLESLHYQAVILNKDGKFKVVATGFADRPAAEAAQAALSKAGIRDPFIVALE